MNTAFNRGSRRKARGREELPLKQLDARRQVCLFNHDSIAVRGRMQRNRIAASRIANRLRIDWRSAILADQAIGAFYEADRSAYFARVEKSNNVSVRFAIEQKAHLGSFLARRVSMQVAIGNLGKRDAHRTIREADLGCRRE